MNAMIDYIGSMVTGGMVFVMMLSYYYNVSATAISQLFNTTTQEDLTSITEIIEYDMRKAGYGVGDSIAFSSIDSNKIVLRGDFNNNGILDSVRYSLTDSPIPGHENPNARILLRKAGDKTVRLTNNPITRFRVWYYDAAGSSTTNTKLIRFARVALQMEGKLSYQGEKTGVYWERTIRPRNLR